MRRLLLPIGMLVLAGVLQGNKPDWLELKGARPDLLLVVLIASALTLDPLAGSILGFAAGLIHSSIVGPSMGSFMVSRILIGAGAGAVTIRLFSDNPIVPVLAAGGLTFIGELVFLLLNPVPDLIYALNVALVKSLFNSLLTLIVFWFLRWIEVRRKIKLATARL